MSRSRKSAIPKALLILAGVAGCAWLGLTVKKTVASDPMARFRAPEAEHDAPGVQMTDFDWKAYDGSKIVAKAHVKSAEVGKDRDQVQLASVTNGQFFDDGKPVFNFEAQSAVYYNDLNSLVGHGNTRVRNDQLDLSTLDFKYDPAKKAVIVPSTVSGKLQGGDMKADSLVYKLDDKSVEVKGIRWSGMVAQDNQKRRWSFAPQDDKSKLDSKTSGRKTTFTALRATDGEIIVLADGGEYNSETDVLVAKGHVRYYGSDANLTCEAVTVYRKEKRAVLTGNVDMLVKAKQGGKAEQTAIPPVTPIVPEEIKKDRPPAPDGGQADQSSPVRAGDNFRDYPTTVTAQRIEYWYGKGNRKAHISGSPQARQQLDLSSWRMVWAQTAVYDGEKETLLLKSESDKALVRMLNSLGDDARAQSVLVSTKEGDDMMEATGVSWEMTVDKDELPEKGGGTSSTGGGGQKAPITGPIQKKG